MSGRPARIAWLLPSLIEGSGGHRTMVQNINALIDAGHECHIYLEADTTRTPATPKRIAAAAAQLRQYFGDTRATVHLGFDVHESYDLVFATAWYTAPFVARIAQPCAKAYFVQDYEAYFSPVGDGFLQAENSYALGLTPITIGRWLTHRLSSRYGTPAGHFDFCAEAKVYRRDDTPREKAVCFICQPEKPRRCPRLGLEALGILKHRMPDVKIYTYGSKEPAGFWFDHTELGLVSIEECNRLYNRCSVGLCISATNPSRIPFEMMAAGLPVVDIHRENNLFDMPDSGMLLAQSRPESLAAALEHILRHDQQRAEMSRAALAFMRDRDLSRGYAQFVEHVEAILAGSFAGESTVEPMYHRPAFCASEIDAATPDETAELVGARLRQVVAAAEELDSIEHSRAWRWIERLKRFTPYRLIARMRYGPGWDASPTEVDPLTRLAGIKRSRAYRLIQFVKRSLAYRLYAGRRQTVES